MLNENKIEITTPDQLITLTTGKSDRGTSAILAF